MTIHYICRGNAFRSILAEAYTKSLEITDLDVISSGSAATAHKIANIPTYEKSKVFLETKNLGKYTKDHYADDLTQETINASDIIVCVNKIVFDEANSNGFIFPNDTHVWDVADVGEAGRTETSPEKIDEYYEEVFGELKFNIDSLIKSADLK